VADDHGGNGGGVMDLRLDSTDLDATAHQLDAVARSADETAGLSGALKAACGAAGHPVLVAAGEHFFDKWTYGLDCIRGDARSLSTMLRTAATGFASVDARLGSGVPTVSSPGN
jgi:hypothetical protein